MGWNYLSIPKLQWLHPNFKGETVEVWEWISNFISLYNGCNYLSMLGLKLIHVSKRGPRFTFCGFLFQNYGKTSVMELALPIAVRFLYHGNRELSRNMSSYLSLAAIDNSKLLANHMQAILDSILSGRLTHWGIVTPFGDIDLGQHWLR